MIFDVVVSPAQVPHFLTTLLQISGAEVWKQREKEFGLQILDNPPFERYIDERFALERAMVHVLRYRRNSGGRLPNVLSGKQRFAVHRLYAFLAMVSRVFPELKPVAQKTMTGKIKGALKDNVGLAPLAFELQTACHFMSHGFDVDFHDLENGGGYDFVARKGYIDLEIECKTVSADLGRKIHLIRQYQLWRMLHPFMIDSLSTGTGLLAIATLPDRLGSADSECAQLHPR